MKNTALEQRLGDEVLSFIQQRNSLQLATLGEDGAPYASYAQFASDGQFLYVLLSDIAVHGLNLLHRPRASVLLIEDEATAQDTYARVRINYQILAKQLSITSADGRAALTLLEQRFGERPQRLAELEDFRLFRLTPVHGRYVKGFGRAYTLAGGSLTGESIEHLRGGHRPRELQSA
jgi:putative heme iron utilization protein